MAHAAGPGRFPVRGGRWRPLLRLLHRAPHAHVFRDALAGLRPDRLHSGLQVEKPHRRRRRHPEPLATASAQVPPRLLLLHVRSRGTRDARTTRDRRLALWLRAPRDPREPEARPLHRREPPPPPAPPLPPVRAL